MAIKKLWPSRWLRGTIFVLIFLLAFVSRAIYPVSLYMLWYDRSIRFSDALAVHDWKETYQSYHPGVTVTWLSSVGIRLFGWREGLSSAQLLGDDPAKPGAVVDAVAAGVIPLAAVIALCIALSYVLLERITDPKTALAGSLLLALDPFHIAYSKVLHPDALLAALMFTSTLFLLNYFHRDKLVDLVLSGVFAGLSFLTKTPSIFLIPYTLLVTGVYALVALRENAESLGWWRRIGRRVWVFIRTLLIWAVAAALVFTALWPAMWVGPLDVVDRVMGGVFFHVDTIHDNPVFFNGQALKRDPGPLFYVTTIAWKTTLITLPAVCIALLSAFVRPRQNKYTLLTLLLAAYVVFFTAQISLGSWKQMAYMVPVFPILSVIAGVGLAKVAGAVRAVRWWREWRWLPVALIVLALAVQAGVVFPHHPYYGTHHNNLLGGSRVAQRILPLQDQGEGLDLAAQYLNGLPRASQARSMVHSFGANTFERYFEGATDVAFNPWINYRVYYANQVMRGLGGEEWQKSWEADRQTTPLWTVSFDGVTYVWVYGAPPKEPAADGPEYEVNARLGEHITLKRVRVSSEIVSPGDVLLVVPIWESDGEVVEDYMVFCHLLSANGELVAQHDGPPIYGVRSTPSWRAGEIIEDAHIVPLGADLAPGAYELSVGMYELESMARVPVFDAAGNQLPDGRIVLGVLQVQIPETPD
jgi:hypothetical protein